MREAIRLAVSRGVTSLHDKDGLPSADDCADSEGTLRASAYVRRLTPHESVLERRCLVEVRRTRVLLRRPHVSPRSAWQEWQGWAFVRVRSSVRSRGGLRSTMLSERTPARTAEPNRQAGGHWFEPSTAHSPLSF
jgi:hypothetical protein